MQHREEGMYESDRCKFCAQFGEKIRPRVCKDCFEMAVDMLEQEGWFPPAAESQHGWISVHTLLPSTEQYVLLCSETGGTAMGGLRADGRWEVDVPRGAEFEPLYWRVPPTVPEANSD